MTKFVSMLIAAVFAAGSVQALAADAKKDEKKTESKKETKKEEKK